VSRGRRPKGTIVFAVPDFEPAVGGTTRQVGLQARALRDRGHEVVVVTRRRERAWPRLETLSGLPVVRLGAPGHGRLPDARALVALAAWLAGRRRHITVLQTVMWPDAYVSAALAWLLRRTAVLWAIRGELATAIRPGGSPPRRLVGRIRRAVLMRCTHVTLTPTMAAELEALPGARAVVIPVPVDVEHFRPPTADERAAARAALGLDEATFLVVYVGHLEARKRVDLLLEAVGLLARDGGNVALLVVGGSRGTKADTEDELRRRAAQPDLAGFVRFVGVQPDPRPLLWAADTLVLPSVLEGMPNSLLEAMACGLPCIAPPSAAGDDVLDAQTGLVPRSNAPEELRAALRDLRLSPDRRRRLGEAARERAQAFSVAEIADRYERLYGDLTGEARA
jgi:glycosyltransferase involved in cell wall biosynthesis